MFWLSRRGQIHLPMILHRQPFSAGIGMNMLSQILPMLQKSRQTGIPSFYPNQHSGNHFQGMSPSLILKKTRWIRQRVCCMKGKTPRLPIKTTCMQQTARIMSKRSLKPSEIIGMNPQTPALQMQKKSSEIDSLNEGLCIMLISFVKFGRGSLSNMFMPGIIGLPGVMLLRVRALGFRL